RVETAHRLPYEDRTLQSHRIDEALDVANMRRDPIVDDRRPLAVAMTTLIERDASIALAQHHRDAVPGMRGKAAAVQKQNRRATAIPIEVMKPHRTNDHLMIVGQRGGI